MFKKVVYLASVSVFSGLMMFSEAHAVYEKELLEVIHTFKHLKKKPLQDTSYISTYVGEPLGRSLRYFGDKIRSDGDVGELLANKALGAAAHNSNYAKAVVAEVKDNEGLFGSFCNTFGNGLRCAGGYLAGEKPTIERFLRNFWVDKGTDKDQGPEEMLVSTACALYLSPEIDGFDEIKDIYRRFLIKCNKSSKLVHSNDENMNLEYFVKGLIRGFALKTKGQGNLNNFTLNLIGIIGFDMEKLPVISSLTAEKVIPDEAARGQMASAAIQEAVIDAKKKSFIQFADQIYGLEVIKYNSNQDRHDLLEGNNSQILEIKAQQENVNNNNNETVD